MKYIVHFILLLLLPMLGRTAVATDTLKVAEVEIMANKNSAIHLIPLLKIDSSIQAIYVDLSLSELLARTSNFSFKTYGAGGSATISFRGANASHTKVLWNGLAIGSPMLGLLDFSIVPSAAADEISIYQGAGSAFVGTGALGGFIELKSSPNFKNQSMFAFHTSYSSIVANEGNIQFSNSTKKLYSHTQLNYTHNQNQYEYVNYTEFAKPTQSQINASVKQFGIIQQLYYQANERNLWSLHTWYQESDRNIGPPIFNRNQASYQIDHSIRSILAIENTSYSHVIIKSSLSYNREYIRYVNRIVNGGNSFELLNSKSYFDVVSQHTEAKFAGSNWKEMIGVDIIFEGANVADYGNYQSRERFSIYSNSLWNIKEDLDLQFVNRYERALKRNLYASLLSLKQSNLFIKHFDITLTASKNYNLPTLNDLYWIPGGNPNLNPETGYELAALFNYKILKKRLSWENSINLYQSIINEWILWQPSAVENGVWTPQNLRQVKLRGLELATNLEYQVQKTTHQININFAFNQAINNKSVGNNDASLGKQLIYVPIEKFQFQYRIQMHSYHVFYAMNRIGYRFTASDNSTFLPSYFLHEIGFGKNFNWKQHAFALNLRADNLTNTVYESIPFRPMPGRVYTIGVTYNLKNKNNIK